jgi:hypothetical protein
VVQAEARTVSVPLGIHAAFIQPLKVPLPSSAGIPLLQMWLTPLFLLLLCSQWMLVAAQTIPLTIQSAGNYLTTTTYCSFNVYGITVSSLNGVVYAGVYSGDCVPACTIDD